METSATSILWPLLAGVLIILANAFFVTVEFAIVTVRRGQMERLAETGNRNASLVSRMLHDPDWAIAGSQVGITVASILLGIVAEEPLHQLLAPVLARLFGRVPFLAPLSDRAGDADRPPAAVVLPHGAGRTDPEDHRAALSRAERPGRRRGR